MMRRGYGALLVAVTMLGLVLTGGQVFAQQATSTNYSVDEAFFGTGGQLCDPGISGYSTNYCAGATAGDLAAGESTTVSGNNATAGSNTSRDEYLELVVNAANIDLGVLSPSTAATAVGTFSVKAYLASGYLVVNGSDPPKNNATVPHTLNALSSPTASSPGNEQFGINLVDNTTPITVGANVTHSPDSSFGFGVAATGYNTDNQFKYVKGDTIASSPKSSGTTNYTVTYLYNISTNTPSGDYTFGHVIVATATY